MALVKLTGRCERNFFASARIAISKVLSPANEVIVTHSISLEQLLRMFEPVNNPDDSPAACRSSDSSLVSNKGSS